MFRYSHPAIMVVIVKRPHSCPPAGRVSRATRSGRHQNSPIKQCKMRSEKWLLLYANANIRMICSTAEGIDNMLLSNVEKPIRFKVSER